jgi:hypothetical protein
MFDSNASGMNGTRYQEEENNAAPFGFAGATAAILVGISSLYGLLVFTRLCCKKGFCQNSEEGLSW